MLSSLKNHWLDWLANKDVNFAVPIPNYSGWLISFIAEFGILRRIWRIFFQSKRRTFGFMREIRPLQPNTLHF